MKQRLVSFFMLLCSVLATAQINEIQRGVVTPKGVGQSPQKIAYSQEEAKRKWQIERAEKTIKDQINRKLTEQIQIIDGHLATIATKLKQPNLSELDREDLIDAQEKLNTQREERSHDRDKSVQIAHETAESLVAFDADGVSKELKQAQTLFEAGKLDIAYTAISEVTIKNKLKTSPDLLKNAVQDYMYKGLMAIANGKFEEGKRFYTEGVLLDNKNLTNLRILANCLFLQNEKLKAISYFGQALSLSKTDEQIAVFSNHLGVANVAVNKVSEAEKYYLQAFNIYVKLAKNNPQQFEPHWAHAATNLGVFYSDINKMPEAERFYLQSLDLYTRLAKTNPQQFEPNLARATMNLGIYYADINKMLEAEKYYLQSLAQHQQWAKNNSSEFEPDWARMAMNLGNYYLAINKMPESEKYYRQSLDIYTRLTKNNPQEFEPHLASTAMNFGNYYSAINKMSESEKYYLQALDIRGRLAKSNPEQFEPDLAATALNLGSFYSDNNKMSQSEHYYQKAFDIYTRLTKKNPQQFEPDLARTLVNFGSYYTDNNKQFEAEQYYEQAFNIYTRLVGTNPQQFEPHLAKTAIHLGSYFTAVNRMSEAEKHYLQAFNIYLRLAKNNPQQFESDLAYTVMHFGRYYSAVKNLPEAEKCYQRSLELYTQLAKNNPQQFEPDLAFILNDYGVFCRDNNLQYDKAQAFFSHALNLRQTALLNGHTYIVKEYNRVFNNLGKLRDTFNFGKSYLYALEIQVERTKSQEILRGILDGGQTAASLEYNSLAWQQILSKKYAAAEQSAQKGLALDASQTFIKTNLAHAFLFQNKDADAKKVYDELKMQKNTEGASFLMILKEELYTLEQAGLNKQQLDKARRWVIE
jgi:tetratricopeptide (TPR) repeat protein